MFEVDLIKKVTLLGIYKKEPDESLNDVMKMLADTGMYDLKEAKQVFKELKAEQFISNEQLTMKGIMVAKAAEEEFKQA